MQRHGGAFAVFATLMVAAFCADQHPARLLQSGNDLFTIHDEFISKKIGLGVIFWVCGHKKT
jgi:hypothetical protein